MTSLLLPPLYMTSLLLPYDIIAPPTPLPNGFHTCGLDVIKVRRDDHTLEFLQFDVFGDLPQPTDVPLPSPGLDGVLLVLPLLEAHQL